MRSFPKYKLNVLKRIDFCKNKLSKFTLNRLYSELVLNLKRIFIAQGFSLTNFQERKVFLYLFQLESLRSIQSGKLVLTRDKLFLLFKSENSRKFDLNYLAYYQSVFVIFVYKI